MKIIDCVWEIANLGKKTCEVSIDAEDSIDKALLDELDLRYEYLVVKVAPGNVGATLLLNENGYQFVENQIETELRYQDFNFEMPLIKRLVDRVSFVDVEQDEDLESIIEKITPRMFVSDRIAVDPHFGVDDSCKRYCNWVKSAFEKGTHSFFQFYYGGKCVGFVMYRIEDNIWQSTLGGVYPDYGNGLGLLTACVPMLYIKHRGIKVSKIVSHISSNNTPVIAPNNYCHFNFKKFTYVFVKHNQL